MGRILAIDYGLKRTGIAVTDPMQMISSGLTTVLTASLFEFLDGYIAKEKPEKMVVGLPRQMNGTPSESAPHVEKFVKQAINRYPQLEIVFFDERFTSKMASQAMFDAGLKKKDRQNKALIDTVSATIILQSYMESRSMQR
jgi:putative holliday junction resolvase